MFFDTVKTMRTNSSRLAPAESLSSIVSLSADNMKDLALPKLNATEDLVDIYTTAFMIGIPFSEISRIMTSPIFTVLTEEGKNNIFDSYTDGLRVKDLISDFLSDTTDRRILQKLNNIAGRYNTSTNSILPDSWYFDNTLVDKVIYEFTRKGGIIDRTQEYVNYDEMSEELDENGNPIQVQQVLKNDVYNLYRYLQFLHIRNELTGSNITGQEQKVLADLLKLKNLLPYVEEMSTLGREGSINQGLKTNITDYYNFAHNLEVFINRRLPQNSRIKFSFKQFLEDENYRES